jgi:quinolinate synthase
MTISGMNATMKSGEDLLRHGYLTVPVDKNINLSEEINRLRKEKNAVILAHYYQEEAIQDIADFIGDSLGLSQQAATTKADIIVFAGVHFMAETAKILNPAKKVLLPDLKSGCSLADSCTAESLLALRSRYPDHVVITYINCSAEVKAVSDIICTSANAEKIVNSIPENQPIIFAPDKNLGKYLIAKTGRDMVLWDGACVVHEAFSIDKLLKLHMENPDAVIIAHPESEAHILKVAGYVGSTTGMINFVRTDPRQSFIVATESGILHQMRKEVPGKTLIPAPAYENNTCACSECAFMRMNTLEKLYLCLRYEQPEVTVPADIAQKALVPVERMLKLSRT